MAVQKLQLIEEIITRPSQGSFYLHTNFNSNALRTSWDQARGERTWRSSDSFESPFFKLFWKTLKHLAGRSEDFKKFMETWNNFNRDHSSTIASAETHNRLYINLSNRRYTPTPEENQTILGCTRLYYIASGINNIPNIPSDQDDSPSAENFVFKAEESHALQKALIKLRDGSSITTKIYKDKLTEARIIYFNKYDTPAVAYLQVYGITKSWRNYIPGNIEKEPIEITAIMQTFLNMLQKLTKENYTQALTETPEIDSLYINLKKIEDEITKISQSDDTLESFAKSWQTRLFKTEKDTAERDIESRYNNSKRLMEQYYQEMEYIKEKQKFLKNILMNDADILFLTKYFGKFKTLPGTLFHQAGNNRLYCLFEAPFAHGDYALLKRQIQDVSIEMTPTNETNFNNSVFASALWWAIRKGSSDNGDYWLKPLIKGYKDKEYWPAFIKAYKRLMMEIWVERKTMMFMSCCIYWNNESNSYIPSGTNTRDLPAAFQPFLYERLWHSHITHFNCWSAATSEIAKNLSKRDADTAFEYTLSAAQQISFHEGAGSRMARYMLGDYQGTYTKNVKSAAENQRVYLREGKTSRENLVEIMTDYITEELKGVTPIEEIKPEIKIKPKKSIEERNVWLEQHHFVPGPRDRMTQIPNEMDTRYNINGAIYIWIPTGDFLSIPEYDRYRALFPDAPISPESATATATETTVAAPINEGEIAERVAAEMHRDIETAAEGLRTAGIRYNPELMREIVGRPLPVEDLTAEFIRANPFAAMWEPNAIRPQDIEGPVAPETETITRIQPAERMGRPQEEQVIVLDTITEQIPPQPENPEQPTEPILRYIQLVRIPNNDFDDGANWHFPHAANMPDEYRDFNDFLPHFNTMRENQMPRNNDTILYDIIEDIIFYNREPGPRHTLRERIVLATDVTEQLRRTLP